MDGERPRPVDVAAPEIRRLQERGQGGGQPGDERVAEAAPEHGLGPTGRAGKVQGEGVPGRVNVAGDGMQGQGGHRVPGSAAEVGRLQQRIDHQRQPRVVGPDREAVLEPARAVRDRDRVAGAVALLIGDGRGERNVAATGAGHQPAVGRHPETGGAGHAHPDAFRRAAGLHGEDLLDAPTARPQRDRDARPHLAETHLVPGRQGPPPARRLVAEECADAGRARMLGDRSPATSNEPLGQAPARLAPRPGERVHQLAPMGDEQRAGEGLGVIGHPVVDLPLIADERDTEAGQRRELPRVRRGRRREGQRDEQDDSALDGARAWSHAISPFAARHEPVGPSFTREHQHAQLAAITLAERCP
jgi:hypothetical protein